MTGRGEKMPNASMFPLSKMLAIKCNPPSLRSLNTGILASVLTGNQQCEFLKIVNGRLVETSTAVRQAPLRLPLMNACAFWQEKKAVFWRLSDRSRPELLSPIISVICKARTSCQSRSQLSPLRCFPPTENLCRMLEKESRTRTCTRLPTRVRGRLVHLSC
jgi:hypothetical protein